MNSQPLTTGPGEQACNECKRRKARCNRVLPQCAPCVKYRRHCLYEEHSKSPLTRKYVTELEERLRVAELRAREAEARAQLAEEQLRRLCHDLNLPAVSGIGSSSPDACDPSLDTFSIPKSLVAPSTRPTVEQQGGAMSERTTFEADTERHKPVAISGDFSWNEQTTHETLADNEEKDNNIRDLEPTFDGMALLTLENRDSGYLGNTSGAAMLRLLLPDAELRKNNRTQSVAGPSSPPEPWISTLVWTELKMRNTDLDDMIDSYFKICNLTYPLVHEPTFRAQYTHVIPRPHGSTWNALALIIATVGAYANPHVPSSVHRALFDASRSNLSFRALETGNSTLVQLLSLTHYYLQKVGKPNSGYVYLGLALHMALALGLHKEFCSRKPIEMENRRRIWWCLFAFNSGAQVTFGRPVAWPQNGVDVALPLNVDDRDLTSMSRTLPPQADYVTPYTSLIFQSHFHQATSQIYSRIVSDPPPSAGELLRLDEMHIRGWVSSIPSWYAEDAEIQDKFRLPHGIMWWRLRNFRIIMYRPFVLRKSSSRRGYSETQERPESPEEETAYTRCLWEARRTIYTVEKLWSQSPSIRTRVGAWYVLFFLFQASLIPCVCLHHDPMAANATEWVEQLQAVLRVFNDMKAINPSAQDCYDVIIRLCGSCIQNAGSDTAISATGILEPSTQEFLPMQINSNEGDLTMQDQAWRELFDELIDPTIGGPLMGTIGDFQSDEARDRS